MWNFFGNVRTTKRLRWDREHIRLLKGEIEEYYASFRVTFDLLELRNLVDVAALMVDSALLRHKSRGLHTSLDYPDTLLHAMPSVLTPEPHGQRRCRS